jgi:hypothetical protein
LGYNYFETGTVGVLIPENRDLKVNKAIVDIKKLVSIKMQIYTFQYLAFKKMNIPNNIVIRQGDR